MRTPSLTTATAKEYRTKYPDKPSLALARIMYNQNKELYTSVEHARTMLRQIEGKLGVRSKITADKSMFKDEPRPYNPYKLPESDETSYEPFVLAGFTRLGVICDVHVPYHSVSALTVAIRSLKKAKIDALVIDGDFWDFHGLSRFIKDPRKKRFNEEINVGLKILEKLQKELNCKIIYKLGNHCERLMLYLRQKVGEIDQLADLEEIQELTLESIVRRRKPSLDIVFVDGKRIIKANELNIVHGHEFPSSIMSPVNIARGLYLRAKANTICGHHHRSSEHTEMDINSRIITTWSVGCLSELHPEFMPINSWNHGFAIVDLHSNGKDFNVSNKRIFNGQVL